MPGAAYDVYMKVSQTPNGTDKSNQLLSTFNFFSAMAHEDGSHVRKATWRVDITDLVRRKLIDPRNPGQLTLIARYADPATAVSVKSYRIEAR
jgi:hypothetical protein